ncbi:MAG: ABC transporter ATP-binding protein [Acidobacteria bacterium]|nr:ABC transporter ATP-binding protein [Acidobacteriota bacterium]
MLDVRGLTKRYNRIPALDNVSFTIAPGEILGYLGPNGAGKSTTVKILTGLMDATSGEIFWNGVDVKADFTAFQRMTGYVPEEAHVYPHLSGREYLQLAGRLRGLGRAVLEARIDALLKEFGLWEDRYSPLSAYSKGMRQKVLLSAGMLHDPKLLILDEPFSGLDVNTALVLRALLRRLAASGRMILYSSHVLEVVEKVCHRVVILRQGRAVAHDRVENLRTVLRKESLEGVFAQLTEQEDPDVRAGRILNAVEAYA